MSCQRMEDNSTVAPRARAAVSVGWLTSLLSVNRAHDRAVLIELAAMDGARDGGSGLGSGRWHHAWHHVSCMVVHGIM